MQPLAEAGVVGPYEHSWEGVSARTEEAHYRSCSNKAADIEIQTLGPGHEMACLFFNLLVKSPSNLVSQNNVFIIID